MKTVMTTVMTTVMMTARPPLPLSSSFSPPRTRHPTRPPPPPPPTPRHSHTPAPPCPNPAPAITPETYPSPARARAPAAARSAAVGWPTSLRYTRFFPADDPAVFAFNALRTRFATMTIPTPNSTTRTMSEGAKGSALTTVRSESIPFQFPLSLFRARAAGIYVDTRAYTVSGDAC